MFNGELVGGSVNVLTVDNRGWNPEELADRAVNRIISIGDSSHPLVAEQARAFREHIRQVLVHYIREAQDSERTTICAKLRVQGHADLAHIIEDL